MAVTSFARLKSMQILSLVLLCTTVAYTKECKKLDFCRCEMDEGSGIIDLNEIDNKDGSPRFSGIPEIGTPYTFNYNPCTGIRTMSDACNGTNLCQVDNSFSPPSHYPCGLPGPVFTVDEDNNVVLYYRPQTYLSYTRWTNITLVCDPWNVKGSIDKIIQRATASSSSVFIGTLKAKSACPVEPHKPWSARGSPDYLLPDDENRFDIEE